MSVVQKCSKISENDDHVGYMPDSAEIAHHVNINLSNDSYTSHNDLIGELDNLRVRLRGIFRSISQAKNKDNF